MKRAAVFLGLATTLSLLGSVRHDATPVPEPVSPIRSESAGGTVSLHALKTFRTPVRHVVRNDDEITRAAARAAVREQEAGTYIREILIERDSALARWHARPERPITVWIQRGAGIDDWNDAYVDAVAAAFQSWNTADTPIRFRVVADSVDAEVAVTWIDHFNQPISGRTRWSRDDNWWIVSAGVVLAVHHQYGELLDQSAMKAMALHEVGHLLGLDHTTDPASIMAARVRVRDLTPVDRATVKLLYSVPAGTLR